MINSGQKTKLVWQDWTIILLCIYFGLIMFKVEGTFLDDASWHLRVIGKMLSRPFISLQGVTYLGEGIDARWAYDSYHLLVPIFCRFSGLNHINAWSLLPVFLTPISIIAYYAFAANLFKDKIAGCLSGLVMTIWMAGIFQDFVGFSSLVLPYGLVPYLLLPVTWLFVLKYLEEGKKKYLGISIFLGFTVATIHIYYFFLFLLCLFSLAVFYYIVNRNCKKTLQRMSLLILLTIVIIGPYLFLRSQSYSVSNVGYQARWINSNTYLKDSLVFTGQERYYLHPRFVFQQIYVLFTGKNRFSILPLVAFFLSPFLLKKAWHPESMLWSGFLISTLLIVPFLMLNPFIVPYLAGILSLYFVSRISEVIPTFLIIGYFLSSIPEFLHSTFCRIGTTGYRNLSPEMSQSTNLCHGLFSHQKRNSYMILIIVASIAVLVTLSKNWHWTTDVSRNERTDVSIKRQPPVVDFLESHISKQAVILSDNWTSYKLLPYTKHYVVAILPGLDAPNVKDSAQRNMDVQTVLQGNVGEMDILQILTRYEVDYILLAPDYCTLSLCKKFEKIGFEKIFDKNGYTVYSIHF